MDLQEVNSQLAGGVFPFGELRAARDDRRRNRSRDALRLGGEASGRGKVAHQHRKCASGRFRRKKAKPA
jgi:hypothetical protein